MTKEKIVDQLLDNFINEDKTFLDYDIPKTLEEKRLFLRGIINLSPPFELSEEILFLEDKLL